MGERDLLLTALNLKKEAGLVLACHIPVLRDGQLFIWVKAGLLQQFTGPCVDVVVVLLLIPHTGLLTARDIRHVIAVLTEDFPGIGICLCDGALFVEVIAQIVNSIFQGLVLDVVLGVEVEILFETDSRRRTLRIPVQRLDRDDGVLDGGTRRFLE